MPMNMLIIYFEHFHINLEKNYYHSYPCTNFLSKNLGMSFSFSVHFCNQTKASFINNPNSITPHKIDGRIILRKNSLQDDLEL